MITIVNFGMGNLSSIHNMLRKAGADAEITSDPEVIEKATKLILPGVGAFDAAMVSLHTMGLIPLLNKKVLQQRTPILGICLGMQLMTKGSEEGSEPGLGWIEADTLRFRFEGELASLKVPHMGWNVAHIRRDTSIFRGMDREESRFYFVHTYYVQCRHQEDVLAATHYGHDFVSSFEHENIAGTQFHPEKSHRFGMQVLKNFAEMERGPSC